MRAMFIRALLLATVATMSPVRQGQAEGPLAQFRFSLQGGLPTTTALINGRELSLFVDLGGFSPIALTPAAAASVNVTYTGSSTRWKDYTGAEYRSRGFTVSSVVLGGKDFGALAGVEHFVSAGSTQTGHSGYIGVGLLQNYLVVLDYPARVLSFFDSGDTDAMDRSCGSRRFPIRFTNGVVQSTIETEKGSLVFQWDTGSSENVLRPSALGLPLPPSGPALQSFAKFVLAGNDLGRTVFPLREFQAPSVDGVLGTDFLESRVFCLDIKSRVGALR